MNLPPEQIRTIQIHRQHSQEMALRLLAIEGIADITGGTKAKPEVDLNALQSKVKLYTDFFERDISQAVGFGKVVETSNGTTEKTLDNEKVKQVMRLVDLSTRDEGEIRAKLVELVGDNDYHLLTAKTAREFVEFVKV